MSTGIGTGTIPPSPQQILGLLLSVDKSTVEAVALVTQGGTVQPAGIALLATQTVPQVQLAVGLRPFQYSISPFRY